MRYQLMQVCVEILVERKFEEGFKEIHHSHFRVCDASD
jgi:hypothetical protein